MITHENLEKFLSLTPAKKVLSALIILVVLILLIIAFSVVIYRTGERNGKTQINQQIQRENEDSQIREQSIRNNAEKLAGQNDLLRAQIEAQADLLDELTEKREKAQVEKLNEIFERHRNKTEEISSVSDVRENTRALCQDYAAAGYKLSDELCPQIK